MWMFNRGDDNICDGTTLREIAPGIVAQYDQYRSNEFELMFYACRQDKWLNSEKRQLNDYRALFLPECEEDTQIDPFQYNSSPVLNASFRGTEFIVIVLFHQ